MAFTKLSATYRFSRGKGAARRMRQKGLVPAVIYGPQTETLPVAISPKEIKVALAGPLRTNTILKLDISGESMDKKVPKEVHVLVKDHQYDPVTRELFHVDLLSVDLNKPVHIKIPLKSTGRSKGEQLGGVLSQIYREISVECDPHKIPVVIEHDISALMLNESVRVKQLDLPEGTKATLDPEAPVIAIIAARAIEEEETKTDEEGAVEGDAAEGTEKATTEEKKE